MQKHIKPIASINIRVIENYALIGQRNQSLYMKKRYFDIKFHPGIWKN